MNTNKIREALEECRNQIEVPGTTYPKVVEAFAELDKAPKVLTDEEAHYLFMGWLHANHADINDNADMSDLCRRAFIDSLRYARDNGYLAPSAGLTVDEAMQAVRDWYAPWDCTNNIWDDLRARLNEKLNTKNQ